MRKFRLKKTKNKKFTLGKKEEFGKGLSGSYKKAKELRSSKRWQKVRELALLASNGMCVYCYKSIADDVHHIKPVADFPELTFVLGNTAPLCDTCHGWMGTRDGRGEDTETQIRDKMEKNLGVRSLENKN